MPTVAVCLLWSLINLCCYVVCFEFRMVLLYIQFCQTDRLLFAVMHKNILVIGSFLLIYLAAKSYHIYLGVNHFNHTDIHDSGPGINPKKCFPDKR